MSDETKRPAPRPSMLRAMLRADTQEHTPEEAARLGAQAYGEIRDDETPLPLPLAPEPTRTGITLLPKLDPPRPPPGIDMAAPALPAVPIIDDAATVPVPLLEPDEVATEATPPPLPPSPASAAAEVWFEDAVTRPSMISDLAGTLTGQVTSPPAVSSAPAFAAFSPDVAAARSARTLLILSSATSLAVGLVLGALLFRGRSEPPREATAQGAVAPALCGPGVVPDAPTSSSP